MPYSDNYYENLSHLLRFFTREGARGYVFGASKDQRLIRFINEELVEKATEKNKALKVIFPDPESDAPVMEQIRRAAGEVDGLIIGNLDELILRSRGEVLLHLNFSRESLQALNKPLLFWASQDNLSRIANQAADLFSQRALSSFVFDEQALARRPSLALEARFDDEAYKSKEEYQALELKIKLLEKQLEEAEAEGLPPKRIADSLALPLAKTYRDNRMAKAALALIGRYGGVASSDLGNLRILGDVYEQANEWEQAIEKYKQAMSFVEPEDHRGLSALYGQLANVYWEMGYWQEAVEWNEKAIQIKEATLEKDDPELATLYNNLGNCYHNLKNFEEALAYHIKAISVREKVLPRNHPDLAQSYNNLGAVFLEKGTFEKALEYFLKAKAIYEETLDANHPSLATSFINLGVVYYFQGEVDKAIECYLKAIAIDEIMLDQNDPNLAIAYNNIARIFFENAEYAQSYQFMKKATTINKKQLPPAHPRLKDSFKFLKLVRSKLKEQEI